MLLDAALRYDYLLLVVHGGVGDLLADESVPDTVTATLAVSRHYDFAAGLAAAFVCKRCGVFVDLGV